MPTVLHIIQSLSLGGASRAAIAAAKYSQIFSNNYLQHQFLCLDQPDKQAVTLAKTENIQVVHSQDQQNINQLIEQADIVHLHYWNHPQVCAFLQNDLPANRLVIWLHVAGDHPPQMITKQLINYADAVIACNPYSFNLPILHEAKLTGKAHMICAGADFARLNNLQRQEHETFNVGYIGTVDFVKMHPHYIRMSASIDIPNIQFMVCGNGIQNLLYEQAKELNAEKKFNFFGHVDDIKSIIEKLDVYGYPLCEDTYAAAELNLQEVMYGGIPPVVFPYGGVKSLIQHGQTGLIVNTELEYKQAIEYLYHHPEFRQQLGDNARKYAIENFGAENAAKQLNPIYENLLNTAKRKRLWGLSVDVNLFNQPVRLSDLIGESQALTGSQLFIESLGDRSTKFEISMQGGEIDQLLKVDQYIAQASPLLASAGAGGIWHYRNHYPQDVYLRFWSGLLLQQRGKHQEAIREFTYAINSGFAHWRINWYLATSAVQINQLDLAKISLQSVINSQPDFQPAQTLLAKIQASALSDHSTVNQPKIKVSAIVSTYNSEAFFAGCLEDLVNQTLYQTGELEIIIIDSNSSENEGAIARQYQGKYQNIIYQRTDQRETIYSAWNRGIQLAQGKYITNANTDDRHRPDALAKLASYLDENAEIGIVYADQLITSKPNETWWNTSADQRWDWPEFDYEELEKRCILGSQPMWRKSLHEKYGDFRPEFQVAGDYEFWLRVGKQEKIAHLPEILGLYFNNIQGLEKSSAVASQETYQVCREYGIIERVIQRKTTIPTAISAKELAQLKNQLNTPLISVIIACYNHGEYLPEALASIVEQTYKNWECLIVDDGSTDQSVLIAEKLMDKYANYSIKLLRKAHSGVIETRNLGLSQCVGQYILFVDADDRIHPNFLQESLEILQANTNIGFIYTDITEFGSRHQIVSHGDFQPAQFLQLNQVPITALFRREIYQQIGGFKKVMEAGWEDWEFWLSAYELGWQGYRLAKPYLYYRQHQAGSRLQIFSSSQHNIRLQKARIITLHPRLYTEQQVQIARQILQQNQMLDSTSNDNINLTSDHSVKLINMNITFPAISPVQYETDRPFWSIMIPTFNPNQYLEETLNSVISQISDIRQVQIEVIDDASPVGNIAEQIVEKFSAYGVSFYRQPENLGLVGNWNSCIKRARGEWVHILHQDDLVLPGFYGKLQQGLMTANQVGAGFSRYYYIDAQGQKRSLSNLERDMAGILPDWLEKIAVVQLIQFPAMVVRRSVYEKLGGFCPEAGYAADWEMWKRIAVHYPIWYEPEPLAAWRQHGNSTSRQAIMNATDIQDLAKSIRISATYLPADKAVTLSNQAQEHYALYALNSAEQLLSLKNYQAAIAQIQGALACSQSVNVNNKLISILNPVVDSAKSGTKIISPEAISQKIIKLVAEYEKNPSNQNLVQQLREQRQQLAEIWLNLSTESLASAYSKFQEAHQKLVYSTFKYELLTEKEINIIEKIKTIVTGGFEVPEAVQYFLAGMLYRRADQLPLNFINAPIPNWLVNDYLKFMFASPALFQEIGEANNYVVFLEKWLGYILHNISNQPNSQIWQAIAQLFSQIGNFIPVYFAESNLKNLYSLRGKILEFYLKNQGCVIDYNFPARNRQKIRLGILCDHYNPLTETFLGLPTFEYLDRNKFEIILYGLQLNHHTLEQYCESRADKLIKLPTNLLDQVNTIRNDDLDILLVTTNVTAIAKSATHLMTHRLARIQTSVFASPVTTGIRNIDYFISGQLSEIAGQAQDFYTEKIKLLEGVGICFNYYAVPAKPAQIQPNRTSWGADQQTLVFISGANFYKIIPEQGETWAKILAQVPNSILVLYPFAPSWSRNYPGIPFMNRMHATFTKYGVDTKRLVLIKALPSRQDVKECLKLADIYLDSYPHSGGSSLIDPLEVGLPTVVRDGVNLRSKHGAGILRSLALDDLVGQDENSYINIAVNLATNQRLRQAKRQEIQAKMQQNPSVLDSRDYGQKIGNLFIELFQEWQSIHGVNTAVNTAVNNDTDTATIQNNANVTDPAFLRLTVKLVNQFKREANNSGLIQELRQIRYKFATFWLQVPPTELANIYQGELQQTYQLFLRSGIQHLDLLSSEEPILQQLTELSMGLLHPQAVNAFLGGMLYFVPGKMLVKNADQRLPAWLLADYRAVFEEAFQADPANAGLTKQFVKKAPTVNFLPPELGNKIIGNINLYQIDQTDNNIINDLRKNRQQMVEICLSIPDQQLADAYTGNWGKVYQLLLNCGLRQQVLLDDEQTILQNLATHLGNGLTAPQGINYLLAIMLYCQPGQLQIEDISQIPDWLQADYQKFM
jgi:predicted O-linked N-acetylglucosamine transferase (SPINDLY family)/glycosyltransferase involved in cell wall biosynthesis